MVFEHIEKLKQEYTDKYVVVDDSLAELRRFKGMTGTVRTVNMNGRALVEFDAYDNIGWYDIDVDFLKVIDKPLPKPEAEPAKKPAAKPAAKKAEKAPSELEKARSTKAAAKTGAGMSVKDVLAAARGQQSPAKEKPSGQAAPAKAKADPKSMSPADVLAAARAEKAKGETAASGSAPAAAEDDRKSNIRQQLEAARQQKGDKAGEENGDKTDKPAATAASSGRPDPEKMSVAEMLAYARAEKSGGAAPATVAATQKAPAEEAAAESPAETPADETPASAPEPAADGEVGSKKDEITSIDEMLAYCRRVDAG